MVFSLVAMSLVKNTAFVVHSVKYDLILHRKKISNILYVHNVPEDSD